MNLDNKGVVIKLINLEYNGGGEKRLREIKGNFSVIGSTYNIGLEMGM